jgi:hypothetical protein
MGTKKRLVWLALAGAAVAAAALLAPEPQPAPSASADLAPVSRPATSASATADKGVLAALPPRETIGRPRGQVFAPRSWAPPAPPRSTTPPASEVAAPPPPPPMPYRVAGKVVYEGGAHIVLAKGDRVIWVREGDTLDDGYRVDSIKPDRVTLTYLPLGVEQHIAAVSTLEVEPPSARSALASAAPARAASGASGAAQLRFEGPQQVRAGSPFNVALKVTSGQAVRASPLQLSYDAKLLEPLTVRAGGFFADGSFSYRVSPSGSIFVGASGKGAVPADAEFLVITFKPIQPGGTAELKLSSLILQGAAGRAIVHDQPAAFRTAIIQ